MLAFVSVIHVLLCVFLIFVILLQPGKDAGMGAALGGGAATTAFGGRGAVTFLSKVTAICAALFFATSLGLSFVAMRTSVAGKLAPAAKAPPPPPEPAPLNPAAPSNATQAGAAAPDANGVQSSGSQAAEPTPAPAPAGEQKSK